MRRVLFSLLVLTQIACGTIANGPLQRIEVDSFPAGAEVRLDECGPFATERATTPAVVRVHRHAMHCRVTVAMEGHEPRTIPLERHVTVSAYGDALRNMCGDDIRNCNSFTDVFVTGSVWAIFSVPSLLVDTATGGLFEQEPRYVATRFDEK